MKLGIVEKYKPIGQIPQYRGNLSNRNNLIFGLYSFLLAVFLCRSPYFERVEDTETW